MSTEITVITNNQPRPVVRGYELTPAELKQFDYLSESELDEREFVRFKGVTYDLGDFTENVPPNAPGRWHAFQSDSFFSGVLVRWMDDYEYVVMGTLIA